MVGIDVLLQCFKDMNGKVPNIGDNVLIKRNMVIGKVKGIHIKNNNEHRPFLVIETNSEWNWTQEFSIFDFKSSCIILNENDEAIWRFKK